MGNKWPSWRLSLTAVLASFGTSFHFGLHLVITNPSERAFTEFLNDTLYQRYNWLPDNDTLMNCWSAVVALFYVGGIVGSLLVRHVADHFGRKGGLILTLVLNAVSTVATMTSKLIARFELYVVARVLAGCAATVGLCVVGMYLTECSPKYCRGVVSMLIGTILQVGILIGSVIAMPNLFGNSSRLWMIDAAELIMTVLTLLALLFVYESPSYLILRGDEAGARKAIKFFHKTGSSTSDGQSYVDRVMDSLREELHVRAKSLGMLEFWRKADRCDRSGTLTGTVVSLSMVSSGITVMLAYSVNIFEKMEFDSSTSSLANIIIMACGLISSLLIASCVDRFGRRQILFITYSLLIVLQIIIVVSTKINETLPQWISYALIVVFALFLIVFSIGPGPIGLFVTSEMLSQNARTTGQSWVLLVQMIGRSIMVAVFHAVQKAIGNSNAFLVLFLLPTFTTLVVVYYCLPETKNRSVREVHEEFDKLPKFSLKCSNNRQKIGT